MLEKMGKAAQQASWQLAMLSTEKKNHVLAMLADNLESSSEMILQANEQDMEQARASNMNDALQDRLYLTPARLTTIANDVRQVCRLNDPIGKVLEGARLDSGLTLQRSCVPLGVIGVIYEARPNVTIDIASLCLKTGNAAILRGGKETHNTNQIMVKVIQTTLQQCGLPAAAVQAIESPDRVWVNELLRLDRYVDMLIPRGGTQLHRLCREHSTIPVITGGIGVCHIYVDDSADEVNALTVIENAKVQRPSACNALETLLVNKKLASHFLPALSARMAEVGVRLHASENAMPMLLGGEAKVFALQPEYYNKEWLSLDLNVALVDDIDQAIEHIRAHGTHHSDAILTQSIHQAEYFVRAVDSAAVYVNASTRFTDGAQFGLGAEVAVSTQKLHARGPMGLEALTTYKWIGYGDHLVRR